MNVITFPENLYTTSGLSILLHSVISLSDAMLCDNKMLTLSIFLSKTVVFLLGQIKNKKK